MDSLIFFWQFQPRSPSLQAERRKGEAHLMTAPAFRTATTFTEYTLHNISTKTDHHTPKNHFFISGRRDNNNSMELCVRVRGPAGTNNK